MATGFTSSQAAADGARFIHDSEYDGCVELTNSATRVVLEPNVGGRVLRYQLNGIEALHHDPTLNGVAWDGRENIRHPSGGRFDVGPEYGGHSREELWLGRWFAEIFGPRSARLTSRISAESGLQLVREFTLGSDSARLRCTQIIRNCGMRPLRTFHWGRTFVPGGGIAIAPLPARGRFPQFYAVGGPPGIIDFQPAAEPNVRIREGMLEIIGPPVKAKFVFDVQPGWLAYLSLAGLLFVKKFAVHPQRPYGELAANNASIWYGSEANTASWRGRDSVVELEPIGPLETLMPGTECSYTEEWWLERFRFPEDHRADLARVRAVVAMFEANLPHCAASAIPSAGLSVP